MARTAVIPVRFEPDERDYIKDVASPLTISEYIRNAVLSEPIPKLRKRQRVPEVNRLTYVELGQIGSNINRIADACKIVIERGQSCNIDTDTLQALSQKLDQIRLQLLAIEPDNNSDDVA